MKFCLALDFGGSAVKHAVVGEDASVHDAGRSAAPLDSPEQFVQLVAELYRGVGRDVDGLAISIPGYVDPDSGDLFDTGAYRNLYNQNISEMVGQALPVRISVENDGKCGALSEAWNGSLSTCRDGAVVLLGTGVGGGVVHDGRVRHGKGFAAGEFSYLATHPDDDSLLSLAVMSCSALGMTYKLCKAKNLDLSVQDSSRTLEWLDTLLADRFPSPLGEPSKVKADGRQVFEWLRQGDPEATRVYREFVRSLAMLVHNIQIVFAPEKIAIGGGLSLEPRVLEDLHSALAVFYEGTELATALRAQVVHCTHQGDGNVVGAAYNYFSRHVWPARSAAQQQGALSASRLSAATSDG